jgi:hypothetical protein
MTGTIISLIGKKETCCILKAEDQTEYFGHERDFLDPSAMRVGARFAFRPWQVPGKQRPEAREIIAA